MVSLASSDLPIPRSLLKVAMGVRRNFSTRGATLSFAYLFQVARSQNTTVSTSSDGVSRPIFASLGFETLNIAKNWQSKISIIQRFFLLYLQVRNNLTGRKNKEI